jgi:(1->4)-alpha-D-glucan 1-alpha-D-glucosylmutase
VLIDPAGEQPLTALWEDWTGRVESFEEEVVEAEREITQTSLAAEVARLGRLAPEVDDQAVAEVLTHFPVYRSYLPDEGGEYLDEAVDTAMAERPDLAPDLDVLAKRLADPEDPLAQRFQQTSGMVMAKGVEDTAFYRRHVLIALNEVGSDPGRFGVSAAEWHAECAVLQANWPTTMTLLSSHDTKRSEDVRARVALLAQIPAEWANVLATLDAATVSYRGRVAAEDRILMHQTLVGVGEIEPDRLVDYLHKATREAKRHTAWVDGDPKYDADVETLARGALDDPTYLSELRKFLARLDEAWSQALCAQKTLQLTMPGVPDVYQGCERVNLSLVDPDNRRPVDFDAPADAKSKIVTTILRLRREQPELFTSYQPVSVTSGNALAFARSERLVVVVNRFPLNVERDGWADGALDFPPGSWTDALTGARVTSPDLEDVLGRRFGAVLVRSEP